MRDEILVVLARCRVIEESALEEVLGFSTVVAQSLVEDKLVHKSVEKYKEKEVIVYFLTDKGESYVKTNLPQVKEIYRGFVLEQDLALFDFYTRRTKEERDSWITRDDLIKKYQLTGTVDGAFISGDGRLEGVKTLNAKSGYDALKKVETFLKHAEIPYVHYLLY